MNRALGPDPGPFWGFVGKTCPYGLSPKRYGSPEAYQWPYPGFDYLRGIEHRLPSASPVFKLAYTGTVGSQALLGIARLEALRRQYESQIAIWPFETEFAIDLTAPIICAEIWVFRWLVLRLPVLDSRPDWAREEARARSLEREARDLAA